MNGPKNIGQVYSGPSDIGGGGGNMGSILDFLKSPGGSSIVSAAMGGIGAIGAGQRQERLSQEQNALQQAIMQQQMAQQGAQGLKNDSLTRDMALESAAPLGWGQGYQQQQLLRNMVLQKMMNGPGVMPTNPDVIDRLNQSGWKPFKPTIPEEWQNVNAFGVNQTMEALANRQGILDKLSGGRAPGLNFQGMGLPGDLGDQLQQRTGDYRQYAADDYNSNAARLMEAINLNRQGTNQQPQKGSGGGVGSRLASAGLGAASGAKIGSMIMPGVGTAIGAIGGGLLGLFKGGGSKQPAPPPAPPMNPYSAPQNPMASGALAPGGSFQGGMARPHVMPRLSVPGFAGGQLPLPHQFGGGSEMGGTDERDQILGVNANLPPDLFMQLLKKQQRAY